MIYTTDFLCTYHLIDDLDDSNILYQQQFLQAFGLADDNTALLPIDDVFNIVNKLTEELYNKYKNNIHIQKLMNTIGNDESDEIRFQLCFSYDFFYIMHNLLCKIITNAPLEIEETINLINKLNIG
tara:strand:+ start:9553 stop:9930 length:378 start_codon:yes stop_codon:yes gene_type:complete